MLALIVIVYFCVVAFFRGEVGTDTANYETMLESFVNNYAWDGREPGFIIIGWFLESTFPSAKIAVRLLGLIFFALLLIYLKRSDRNERFFLMGYFIPSFAFQYSMNGLRLGLASAVLLLAAQQYRIYGALAGVRVSIFAIMFHYSIFFSILFLILSQRPMLRFSSIYSAVFLFFIGIAGSLLIDVSYLNEKISAYGSMQAPSALSGFSKVIVVALFVVGVSVSRLPTGERVRLGFIGGVFLLCFWLLTQYSYAGLRMLDLLSLAFPLAIVSSFGRLGLEFDLRFKLAVFSSGVVSVLAVYRGFVLETGLGKTPFLPYNFLSFTLF